MEKTYQLDQQWMKRALKLSLKGKGRTYPNPMVGAVIVKNGRLIGEGWHRGVGLPHAEVEAIASCREDPQGATLYVTLEPCNHHGRTPPCTEAILKAGIGEVHYAMEDPNPQVAGGGARRLKEAGLRVFSGTCREEAVNINKAFIYHCRTGRPWVILKAAMSLDGKIACSGGESRWITGEIARRNVHSLRAEVGAVLVGVDTAIQDRPLLTDRRRKSSGRQPLKVILDSDLRLPLDSPLVTENPERLLIFCTDRVSEKSIEPWVNQGVTVFRSGLSIEPTGVLTKLGALGVQSILIEGGRRIFTAFQKDGLIQEYYLFYAPSFIGGGDALDILGPMGVAQPAEAPRIKVCSIQRAGEDILIHGMAKEG